MAYRVIMEGTGEEILARSDEWRHLKHLQLVQKRAADNTVSSQQKEEYGGLNPQETRQNEEENA